MSWQPEGARTSRWDRWNPRGEMHLVRYIKKINVNEFRELMNGDRVDILNL